jgi:MoaA/NifB/PqqE/SkfB family radical SAM enzyme
MNERFSDLRVLRWHDRISGILAGERLGPIRANLDLTNLCSHSCPWCEPLQYREQTVRDKNHTLETDTAIHVIQDLAELDCKTLNLSGGGEPTIHPDFGLILRFAVRQGLRTWVVTHGGLIHKWLNDLCMAHHVRISLDASNAVEHKEMHGSKDGEFEKVCENIAALCKVRDANKSHRPEVGIAYIVADCNSAGASLQRAFEFASSFGLDFIHFRPLSEDKPERFTGDWLKIAAEIEMMAPACPTVQCFPLGKRWKDVFHQREFKKCYSSLTNAVIGANGDVVACCDRRDLRFGNVNEQSFKSIWLSARQRIEAKKIVPEMCSRCLMCSYNKSVERYIINNDALPELM